MLKRKMKSFQLLMATSFLFLASLCLEKIPALAEELTIQNPTFRGYGLDYCREWKQNCGLPAANAYCQLHGFTRARDFQWVQGNQKTRVINGGQVCDSGFCDRLTEVTCETTTTVFNNPTIQGYGLDSCREWRRNCGWPAAHAYCESQGFNRAIYYRFLGNNQKTRVITSGQVCDDLYCYRITQVTCSE
jgi:hypothetical protein